MSHAASGFFSGQRLLATLGALWVLGLTLSHWQLPEAWVWGVAALFSAAMNFVYFPAAMARGQYVRLETLVATVLVAMSLLGAIVSPWFLIAAVAAHGVWDVLKHMGVGVPFFSWYTLGCAAVDFVYSGLLAWYLVGL